MSFLTGLLGTIMRFCYNVTHNYGLAIILFTLFSKVALLPVTIWVQKNSIKMVKLMPELNRIKINHFGDKDTIADEESKLYKENKYHPLATIVPLLLQIVLLIGIINVIYHPLDNILNVPKETSNEFEQIVLSHDSNLNPESNSLQLAIVEDIQSGNQDEYRAVGNDADKVVDDINNLNLKFLGFDLSWIAVNKKGIVYLAPILAGLSALLLSFLQNRMNVLQSAQSGFGKYSTMALTVGISLYLGAFVPVGVALYWVASNLFTILQQYILNLLMNPKKYVDYEELETTKNQLQDLEKNAKLSRRKLNDPLRKRERDDYKRFFSIGKKKLVFYSESNGFYKYYADTIEYILKNTDIHLHYITSDPNDDIFEMEKEYETLHGYYIGEQRLITLMMKMDADVVVMTMPDLETYQIKRSYVRKDIKYIYIPHCMNSLNLTMRKGCTDHFDAVLCTGKHQKEEIIKTEEVYDLPKKELVEAGYPLLDTMIREYNATHKEKGADDKKVVLIAPSWQKDNIVDSCLDEILEQLKGHDYQVIVRPHPQHVRLMPERMEQLKEKFKNDSSIEIQTDFTSNSTVFDADMIITDWSGIGYEYAITTKKPVLFIDTPMKVMNPEWEKIEMEPFNIYMRDVLGAALKLDEINKIEDTVEYLFEHSEEYKETIQKVTEEYCYALGRSGEVSAKYIIMQVFEQIEKRNGNAKEV